MAVAEVTEQYAAECKQLVEALAKGPKLLSELPKALREADFLEFCVTTGRVLLGRPEHSWEHKPGHAESHSERPKQLKVQADKIGWTDLGQTWHKSVYEMLSEEEDIDPALRLRIKLARRKA